MAFIELGVSKYAYPKQDLDVFEIDSIMLDYFVKNNNVAVLPVATAHQSEDFFDFAWTGSMVDGRLYGIPRLLCTKVLFCRKGDSEILGIKSLDSLYQLLGNSQDLSDQPPPAKGLLIDLGAERHVPASIWTRKPISTLQARLLFKP